MIPEQEVWPYGDAGGEYAGRSWLLQLVQNDHGAGIVFIAEPHRNECPAGNIAQVWAIL
jgi:hypothetical protein